MASHLQQLQERYGAAIDQTIEQALASVPHTERFVGMMRYQLGYVDESLEPSLRGAGKRFRPVLCLLACEAVSGSWREALTAAAAIELLHNFSLIHDDIEDRDPSRRHRPTVWKVWGEAQAINVGDGMFALACQTMLRAVSDPPRTVRLSRRFQDVALSLADGQYLDVSFESGHDVSVDDYLEMIDRKTAALIGFSLWCGATIGLASNQTAAALGDFGRELGKAFQVFDDVQGIWGPPESTGKQAATDLHNRKKTLPVLLAMQASNVSLRRVLEQFYAGSVGDIEGVMQVLEETRSKEQARRYADNLLATALSDLRQADIADSAREVLSGLAAELLGVPAPANAGTVTNL